jgi:hypothetical protein
MDGARGPVTQPPAAVDRPADGDVFIEADNKPEVCDTMNRVLLESNSSCYQRGDVPVLVVQDEDLQKLERPYRVVPLDADSFAQQVNRNARVYRRNQKSGNWVRVNLPPEFARTSLAERRYAFPPLQALAETPLILPNGDVLLRPGYSIRHGILLHFDERRFASDLFRLDPTPDDADGALAYLQELISGFPFVEKVDRAVALATLMTAVYRPGLLSAPATATTARAPGTGKTTLQSLYGLVATGRHAGLINYTEDEIELRKLILSVLLTGDGHMPIDNVNGTLRSDVLCLILTAPSFTQRMLGGNEAVTVPTRVLVTVNGNNLQVAGDLVRRFLVCRLDAGIERPETRSFKFDPIERLKAEREQVVAAILTLTQAYLRSGDRMKLPAFAGFDEWSRLVREPLAWVGAGDPVASVEIASQLDPDRQQLEAMVLAVRNFLETTGERDFDVSSLVGSAKAETMESDDHKRRRQLLREAIEDVAMRAGGVSNKALGRWLARVEGRIALGSRFMRRGDKKGEAGLRWRLEQADGAG